MVGPPPAARASALRRWLCPIRDADECSEKSGNLTPRVRIRLGIDGIPTDQTRVAVAKAPTAAG
ncbi:hypothetical protein BAL199_07828 [alpha proteobacterium BAL199]|nr:hypothetical protein BAL199_07828 [alpha proteobacterium BAL199]